MFLGSNGPAKATFMVSPDFPGHVLQATRLLHRGIVTKLHGDPESYDGPH